MMIYITTFSQMESLVLPTTIAAAAFLLLSRTRLVHSRRRRFLARLLKCCEAGFGPELALAAGMDKPHKWFSAEDENHWSPLIMACKAGHVVLVSWLLQLPVSNIDPTVEETHSALRAAALGGHAHICEMLLNHGARVNVLSAGKRTPLMGACMNNHVDVCKVLLSRNAKVDLVNSTGETARDLVKSEVIMGMMEKLV
jgi:hypothetical protein